MSLAKTLLTGLLIMALMMSAGLAFVYLNLSHLAGNLAQGAVPGLTVGEVKVSWHGIQVEAVEYLSPSLKRVTLRCSRVLMEPSWLSLFGDPIELRTLTIDAPEVYLERQRDGRLVLPLPESGPPESSGGEQQASPRLRIGRLQVVSGVGEFLDRTVPPPQARLRFRNLELTGRDLSFPAAATAVPVELSFILEGTPEAALRLSGWINPEDRSCDLELDADNVDLSHSRPYLRDSHSLAEQVKGALFSELQLRMDRGAYHLTGRLTLANLDLGRATAFLGVPAGPLSTYLQERGSRLAIPVGIRGNLNEGPGQQSRLVKALVKSLLEQLIRDDLSRFSDRLTESGLEGRQEPLDQLKERAREWRDLWTRPTR